MKDNLVSRVWDNVKIGGIVLSIPLFMGSCNSNNNESNNEKKYFNFSQGSKGENTFLIMNSDESLVKKYFFVDTGKNVENFKFGNNPKDYIRIETEDSVYVLNNNEFSAKKIGSVNKSITRNPSTINSLFIKYNKQMHKDFKELQNYYNLAKFKYDNN